MLASLLAYMQLSQHLFRMGTPRFAPTALASFQPPAGLLDVVYAEMRLPDEGKLLI